MWLKKKNNAVEETEEVKAEEVKAEEPKAPVEEWIWVEGYKGTDKDMKCAKDYQYSIGVTFDMPDDAEIEMCCSGFHLCKDLSDVFSHYPIREGNRFFKVKALVRKEELDGYYHRVVKDELGFTSHLYGYHKLVAKSIIFTEELTADDIIKNFVDPSEWTEEQKQLALNIGINEAVVIINQEKLVALGYSVPFAAYIVKQNKFDIAKAVGSQTDLSMDMKCFVIFNS